MVAFSSASRLRQTQFGVLITSSRPCATNLQNAVLP